MPIARRNLTATPLPEELDKLAEISIADVADARTAWRAHTGDLRELLEARVALQHESVALQRPRPRTTRRS